VVEDVEGLDGILDELRRDDEPAVFYIAGGTDVASAVARKLARAGIDAQVIGGDELNSGELLAELGPVANQLAAVMPGTLPPTRGVAVPGMDNPGPFGAAAFDAATAVRQTMERCLPPASGDASNARVGCLSELAAVSFDGVTGPVSFDAFGDRSGAYPYIMVGSDSGWHTLGTL
jgi:ABC-type branched-subunit amino acid transport system substrate-binding protein